MLGQSGTLFARGTSGFTILLPVASATFFFEIDGKGLSRAEFIAFAQSLSIAPEDDWAPVPRAT